MGAEATALQILTRPWFPRPLAKALVQAFAAWRVRQLARADRDAGTGALAAETLDRAIYLLDGYHGGIPFWDWLLLAGGGLWEALLWPAVGEVVVGRAQRSGLPAVLELDGHTFSAMKRQQGQALARLREAVTAGTIEVVNGTYAQPFLGTLSGES
ncbi:MAG TPA: hypothetical protein VLY63_28005, partial [Anaerolineae bacterium]|nr:hypothetical protein [Anaerolineae bacterium]